MKKGAKSSISKIDAATAQLETAIKLYFEDRDLISAYTLCAAADGILEDIWRHEQASILNYRAQEGKDISHLMFSAMEEWDIRIKPEFKKEVFKKINATRNFLKHADTDHNKTHSYHQIEETGLRLLMTCRNFRLVSVSENLAVNTFLNWFVTLNPQYLAENNPLREVIPENMRGSLTHSELTAVGYQMLLSACPELFPPTDLESRIIKSALDDSDLLSE